VSLIAERLQSNAMVESTIARSNGSCNLFLPEGARQGNYRLFSAKDARIRRAGLLRIG
jgi:hypothetical protein